jgi:hypothetical protein
MNPMHPSINDIPSTEGMGMIIVSSAEHATGAERAEWFGQMTVSPLTISKDFPAMSTPVTWRNAKPHWR